MYTCVDNCCGFRGAQYGKKPAIVLFDSGIDGLFADSKTPFVAKGFNVYIHSTGSRAREAMEHVHFHNHALCNAVIGWKKYRECVDERPRDRLLLLLIAGYGGGNVGTATLVNPQGTRACVSTNPVGEFTPRPGY